MPGELESLSPALPRASMAPRQPAAKGQSTEYDPETDIQPKALAQSR